MVGLVKNTKGITLSYEEVDQMCRKLAARIEAEGQRSLHITYHQQQDMPAAALLAFYLGSTISPDGKRFSIVSSPIVDFAFYDKRHESQEFDTKCIYVDEIFEEHEKFPSISVPWVKS